MNRRESQTFTHPDNEKSKVRGIPLRAGDTLNGTRDKWPADDGTWKSFSKAEGIVIGEKCPEKWVRPVSEY